MGMNKFILMLLLVMVSNNAMAAWVKVAVGSNSSSYIDPATIEKNKTKVTIWTLLDFYKDQTAGKLGYASMKSQHEYDCKNKQVQILQTTLHSKNMGKGNTVYSDSEPAQKAPVSPESMIEDLWEYSCGMK
jgi:hypothetical protein